MKININIIGLGESPRMGIPSWMVTVRGVRLRSLDNCLEVYEKVVLRLDGVESRAVLFCAVLCCVDEFQPCAWVDRPSI
jgi:hypothetical protein